MPKIVAICLATGRVSQLNESIASFIAQDFKDSQLMIVNTCQRISLVGEFERVRLYNPKTMDGSLILPLVARNWALDQVPQDSIIIAWDECSVYLPNFLSQVAQSIEGREWCYLEKEYCLDSAGNLSVVQGTEFSFAFTKAAWAKGGKYQPGINGASERNLMGRIIQQQPGEPTAVGQSINLIRIGTPEERERIYPVNMTGHARLKPALARDYASIVELARTGRRESRLCVVLLGRFGDLINLLPCLKLINDLYKKPALMVSQEFASLFDGVSYVDVKPTTLKNEELGQAIAIAKQDYQIVLVGGMWGKGWVQHCKTTSYNAESWSNMGLLHKFNEQHLRPVFDLRNIEREETLLAGIRGYDSRPMILVNVSKGISSPCPACAALLEEIRNLWKDFNVIDLSQYRAERIYDFLSTFEEAACLVCLDSAFLHLATATAIPVVALVNDKGNGWGATKMRCGNAVIEIPYSKVNENNRRTLHEGIAAAIQRPNSGRLLYGTPRRVENRRVWHCVERHEYAKPDPRLLQAWDSWDTLYQSGELIPAHYWNYIRRADKEIGDKRDLPYLKDCLSFALKQMEDHDILMFTNDDNTLHPEVAGYLKFHCSVYGPCTSFRSEFRQLPSFKLAPHQFDVGAMKHMGRDLFAATKEWFSNNWERIPDFILGAAQWDLCIATLVRLEYGIETTNKNIHDPIYPAEIPRGYIHHVQHQNYWSRPDNEYTAPSQLHNAKLWRSFAEKYAPQIQFTERDTMR